jgi:hypothetical protein
MGIAMAAEGAFDFTLHLGDSAIRHAEGVGEMCFASRIYRRFKGALERSFRVSLIPTPPDLMLFVEQGKDERPHLHGVVLAPTSKRHRRLLRDTLLDAAGRDWKPSGRNRTQLELGLFYEPVGWIGYVTKFHELTKNTVGDNVFACSQRVTQAGRNWYENARSTRVVLLPGRAMAVP